MMTMRSMTANEKDADDSDMDYMIILIFHWKNLFLVVFFHHGKFQTMELIMVF